jgi:CheY-like chemotaxis protein
MELLITLIFDLAEALPSLAAPHRVRLTVSATPEGSKIRLQSPVPLRAPPELAVASSLAQRLGLQVELSGAAIDLLVGRRTEERPGRRPTPPPRHFSLPPTPSKKKPAVLVIDDDPRVGAALRRLLTHDADVMVLSSAAEALETLSAGRRFALILCDLMMPGMTGMQFHEALQATVPELVERVAYMTGGAFSQGARQFLESVKNTRLEKPVDVETLRNLVRQAAAGEP